jgi:hypothetical protein
MRFISDDHFFAGWLLGLEYVLWSIATGDRQYKGMDYDYLREKYGEELKVLAEEEGVWYRWDRENCWNEAVTLPTWEEDYAANAAKAMEW